MVNINAEIGREFLTETQLVTNIQRQTEKEKLCVTSGIETYYNLLEKARLRKNLENLKPEQRIIKNTVAPLATMLKHSLGSRVGGTRLYIVTQAKDYLRRLPIEEIAFITLSLLMEVPKDNACTVQNLATELGERLLQQINMKRFTSELPGLSQAIEESIKLYDRRMKNKVRTANFKKQTDYEAIVEFDKDCQIYYSLWNVEGERYFQSELRGDALSLNDGVKHSSLLSKGEKQWLRTTLSIFTKLFDTFEQKLT